MNAENLVKEASEALGTEPDQLPAAIRKFKKEIEELETEAASLKRHLK